MDRARGVSGSMAQQTWSRGARIGLALGLLAAGVPLLFLRGFTVDDALITARVAHHIALGLGSRFNPDGPSVDAVTPLGFAHLMAIGAGTSPQAALAFARVTGAVAWLAAAAWLGSQIGLSGRRIARFSPLLVAGVSVPLGAWASSGMETGLVTLLATLALGRARFAPVFAGLAAAWRPELLPWAMVLSVGVALSRERRPGPGLVGLALATLPALVVALVRAATFGMAMPLAVLAKPASLDDGLRYALSAFLLSGLPLLLLAPRTARALPPHEMVVGLSVLTHFAAVALAGGDWMPSFRLLVPVLPACVWVGAALAERAPPWATSLRLLLALAASALLARDVGPASRHVYAQRLELQTRGRSALAGARRIATLDAGWVGVATGAHVVDVAGVTDPKIARLPGGHTSKRLADGFLEHEGVDAVVALWDGRSAGWYRQNDARLFGLALAAGFVEQEQLPLSGSSLRYRVLRRSSSP